MEFNIIISNVHHSRGQLIQSFAAKFLTESLKLVNDNDDSGVEAAITRVSKQIVNETKTIEIDKTHYETRLHTEVIENKDREPQ